MKKPMKPLPNDIMILGVGMTPVGEHWDKSLRGLALEAIQEARRGAPSIEPQVLYTANMLAACLSRQTQLAALIADFAALRGIDAVTIEAAGASGGLAFRQAVLALASGQIDSALVVGVEKFSERVTAEVESALATASDGDYEAIHGLTNTAQAALLMQRYLMENDAPADALAGFPETAHLNGSRNPIAMFRRALKEGSYQKAAMISSPLNMYDAAPQADGAAAILLARSDAVAEEMALPRVRVRASAAATDALAVHDRPDPLLFKAAEKSSFDALQQAGLRVEDVDFFELHDRFSIFAALSLEAAGFASRGEGWKLARNGDIMPGGTIPICTMGGSKARGDAGGAAGLYQLVETTLQLQGLAGEAQIKDAQIGMAQCLGGPASTAVTHILERVN